MIAVGHHVYTSFGGQRTVHLSPSLAGWGALLEERAAAAYGAEPGFEAAPWPGGWCLTAAVANGRDHVGRPRSLVHQLVIASPCAVSAATPLLALPLLLPRLDHDDPFLDRRLASELAGADAPDAVLPGPAGLVAACGGAAAVLAGAVEAVAGGGWTALTVPPEQFDAVVAGSGLALAARPGCWIGTWAQPLPAAAPAGAGLRLVPGPAAAYAPSGAGAWIVDQVRRSGWADRLAMLLAPLAGALASPGVRAALGSALEPEWPPLAADGSLAVEPDDHRSPALLAALAAAGATAQVRAALARWRPLALSVGMLDELHRVLADPTAPAVAGLCARLDDRLEPASVQIHTERMKKIP
jgi:hypothetical protein